MAGKGGLRKCTLVGALLRPQQFLFGVDQRRRIVAGDFEIVAVGDGVGGAGFHAVAAEDAAVVVDVVDIGVALAAAEAFGGGVFGRFDINAVGRAGGRAQEACNAFLQAVLVALEHVHAAITLLQLRRAVWVVLGYRRREHLPEGDAHASRDGCGRLDNLSDLRWHFGLPADSQPLYSSVTEPPKAASL